MRHSPGFSLLETLIVVLLISIIAAMAAPRLLDSVDRGRQSATMGDMRALGTALERYAVDHQRYPAADRVRALRAKLAPEYIKDVPQRDGWRNPLVYEVDASGHSYILRSPGKDGAFQEGDAPADPEQPFALDIVFSDGMFLQAPGIDNEDDEAE